MSDDDYLDPDDPAVANMTVSEVRDWMRARIEQGVICPCCTGNAKVYTRPIYATMARDLIRASQVVPRGDAFFAPNVILGKGGDFAKLRHWGLIEKADPTARREDGSNRLGWWRLTELGGDYVDNKAKVPHKARLYTNRLLNLKGDPKGILDALGTKFRYDVLMGWVSDD